MTSWMRQPRCLCGCQDSHFVKREIPRLEGSEPVWTQTADPNWGGVERITCTAITCGRRFVRRIGERPPPLRGPALAD